MAERIIYDVGLMDDITSKYNDASQIISDIDTKIEAVFNAYDNNFEGAGKEIAKDSATKIREHLMLLSDFCVHMGEYVKFSKEEMVKADQAGG